VAAMVAGVRIAVGMATAGTTIVARMAIAGKAIGAMVMTEEEEVPESLSSWYPLLIGVEVAVTGVSVAAGVTDPGRIVTAMVGTEKVTIKADAVKHAAVAMAGVTGIVVVIAMPGVPTAIAAGARSQVDVTVVEAEIAEIVLPTRADGQAIIGTLIVAEIRIVNVVPTRIGGTGIHAALTRIVVAEMSVRMSDGMTNGMTARMTARRIGVRNCAPVLDAGQMNEIAAQRMSRGAPAPVAEFFELQTSILSSNQRFLP